MSYPIKHISFSSMRSFHTNPGGWKERYILGNNTYKTNPSQLAGKMAHGVIEAFMQGIDINLAQQAQLAWLDTVPDDQVKWGKTGTRQGVIDSFTKSIAMYFEEMPKYEKVLGIEKEMLHTVEDMIDWRQITSPLPFKGIADLIYEEKGHIIVEDFKFVTAHTKDEEGPHPNYWTQAMFYYYLVRQEFKKDPREIRFREIKGGKNKDWSSQQNVITLNYTSEDFQLQKSFFWYQLLGMCKAIENADADTYMIYNTFDMLNGREAFQQLLETQFGYKQEQSQTDLVKTERGAIKETQFIEQRVPDSIEGKMVFKFQEFGIALQFVERREWHAYDRYLFKPNRGVKMSDVRKYADDVSQATSIENVRILAPVPGTEYVWVEVPRTERNFEKYESGAMPIGKDIDWTVYNLDLEDSNTPHMIVAWRTGSGKSEFLKVLIESRPEGTELRIVDPKRVELKKYKELCWQDEYACEPIEAWVLLSDLKRTMDLRYMRMEEKGVNDVSKIDYNRIMVVIEEYASLRLDKEYGATIEALVLQLTNLGRAAGIHIILATQRPDVKIITGSIKANIGCRVCFATASQIDSKIVLDQMGAEKLAGKGDMLYLYPGQEPVRLQSFYL